MANEPTATDADVRNAVTALFSSSRLPEPTDADVRLYRASLGSVTADELREATKRIVTTERWDFGRKPSPAMVCDALRNVRAARRARSAPAQPEGPVIPPEQLRSRIADVRAANHLTSRSPA